jgi:hypothetical protein
MSPQEHLHRNDIDQFTAQPPMFLEYSNLYETDLAIKPRSGLIGVQGVKYYLVKAQSRGLRDERAKELRPDSSGTVVASNVYGQISDIGMSATMRKAIEGSPTDNGVLFYGDENAEAIGVLTPPCGHFFIALRVDIQRRNAVLDTLIIDAAKSV